MYLLTWLKSAGNRVGGALDRVLGLLEGGLLAVWLEGALQLVTGSLAAAKALELLARAGVVDDDYAVLEGVNLQVVSHIDGIELSGLMWFG